MDPYSHLYSTDPGMQPVEPPPEGVIAEVGELLPEGSDIADQATVIEALRTVHDPEIPVNIYDLGLIYSLDIAPSGDIAVVMSLTSPHCPVAGDLPWMVAWAVNGVAGTGVVQVSLTWEPPWTPEMMSEDAKLALGFF